MENLAKVELIAQHLDALLAAVQAIELKEAGDAIKRISAGLRVPKVSA